MGRHPRRPIGRFSEGDRRAVAAALDRVGVRDLADRDRHRLGGAGPLGDIADSLAVVELVGRLAEQAGASLVGPEQPEHELHQRRLAEAVGTDEGDVLVGVDPQGDVLDDWGRRVAELGARQVDHRFGDGRPAVGRRSVGGAVLGGCVRVGHTKFRHPSAHPSGPASSGDSLPTTTSKIDMSISYAISSYPQSFSTQSSRTPA